MKFPSRKVVALAGAIGGAFLIGAPDLAIAQSMFDPTPTAPAAAPAPAVAQDAGAEPAAKPKAKPKKRAPREATRVNVNNRRSATLLQLEVTSASSPGAKAQVVAAELASGKRKTSNLARRGGCIYNISGSFDDESTVEVAGMDLCKDANINLTD
jgi:hypothetical protein